MTMTPNAQRLLRELIADGPAFRADLARTLGVSRATVTNLVNRLQEDGWVEEPGAGPGTLKTLIGTSPRLGVLASVMFMVDTCVVAVSTLDGRLLSDSTVRELPDLTATERITRGAELLEETLGSLDLGPASLRAVHLAVDTQMDARTGDVHSARASSRWYGVNPKQFFAARFDAPVYLQNTARLEGLAEYLWGVGRQHGHLLFVDVSHGVTSAQVIGGIIQSGARGGSGELGHTIYDWNGPLCACGNTGCLMEYVSIPALLRDLRTSGTIVDWAGFVALARASDPTATMISTRAAEILGQALMNTCHLLDPEIVVLSGGVALDLPGFIDTVADVVRSRALPLVGRDLQVIAAGLEDTLTATALAGIESLRADDALIAAAVAV